MAVEGKLPAVPETILKRRKRQAENRALRAKEAVKSKVELYNSDFFDKTHVSTYHFTGCPQSQACRHLQAC